MITLAMRVSEGGGPSSIPKGGLVYLSKVLSNTLTLFIVAGAFLLVIYIVWAGIQMISSGGDKQKVAAARAKLTWSIVGFIILLVSTFIVNAVGYFFKVDLLKLG